MNKYHRTLDKILRRGKVQENKKGSIKYLVNQKLELKPADLLEIFEGHVLNLFSLAVIIVNAYILRCFYYSAKMNFVCKYWCFLRVK